MLDTRGILSIMDIQELQKVSRVRALAKVGEATRIRERAGVSRAEMATAIGVNRSQLSVWEAGRQMPRPEAALRWLEALEALETEEVGADGAS